MNAIVRTPIRLRHETRRRLVQVVRVEQLSPLMRRIVLGGSELDGFTSAAADDHVKLFFPPPGHDRPASPVIGPDGPTYPSGLSRPVSRDYTPRRFDAAARELTIEFVMHGDGPAASWAAQAVPGQWLGVGGPRGSLLVPEDYDHYLLVGDETALPAIGRRLEEMRPGASATVLIEVADAAEERHLPTAANARIVWLHRNGVAAGTTPLLEQALRAATLPDGDIHAWLAGEIDIMRTLRNHLVEERRIPRAQIRAAGYWRLGEADAHGRLEE